MRFGSRCILFGFMLAFACGTLISVRFHGAESIFYGLLFVRCGYFIADFDFRKIARGKQHKDYDAMRTFRDAYESDGYVFPIDVIVPEEVAALRADYELAEAELADDLPKKELLRLYPDRLLPSFARLIRHPVILDHASQILGPDLMVWGADMFIKEPRSSKIVSWHQDLTYWGLDDATEATCWVALSDASIASGCMQFVAGSHKYPIVPHKDTFAEDNLLSRGQEIAVEVNEDEAVSAELAPGQASFHHGHLFHGSPANQTDDRRMGIAIRLITPVMKQTSQARTMVTHVLGEDKFDHFDLVVSPTTRLDAVSFAACEADNLIRSDILYAGA